MLLLITFQTSLFTIFELMIRLIYKKICQRKITIDCVKSNEIRQKKLSFSSISYTNYVTILFIKILN